MVQIYGEYKVSMDAKGRMLVPAEVCKQLPEVDRVRFHVRITPEGALALYTESQWAGVVEILSKLNPLKSTAMAYKRSFLNGYRMLEVDSANRILIPKNLQESAGLSKDVVFWGLGEQVEIWDAQRKEAHLKEVDGLALADELFN